MRYLRLKSLKNTFDLSLSVTLCTFLLVPVGNYYIRPIILFISLIGLIFPGHLRNPTLWLSLTILTATRVVLDWPIADNHAYLLCYWCLAIFVALKIGQTSDCLITNSRLMIGLVFFFATLWKLVLSPDYTDGQFFRITMITDPRLEGFTRLVGGLTLEEINSLRNIIEPLVYNSNSQSTSISIENLAQFNLVATFASYWNILINSIIAVAFLWRMDRGISKYRDLLLILYCVVTYAVATVEGFGWLLIAMGISQCKPDRKTILLLYLVTFILILFYREVPWSTVLLRT